MERMNCGKCEGKLIKDICKDCAKWFWKGQSVIGGKTKYKYKE